MSHVVCDWCDYCDTQGDCRGRALAVTPEIAKANPREKQEAAEAAGQQDDPRPVDSRDPCDHATLGRRRGGKCPSCGAEFR